MLGVLSSPSLHHPCSKDIKEGEKHTSEVLLGVLGVGSVLYMVKLFCQQNKIIPLSLRSPAPSTSSLVVPCLTCFISLAWIRDPGYLHSKKFIKARFGKQNKTLLSFIGKTQLLSWASEVIAGMLPHGVGSLYFPRALKCHGWPVPV